MVAFHYKLIFYLDIIPTWKAYYIVFFFLVQLTISWTLMRRIHSFWHKPSEPRYLSLSYIYSVKNYDPFLHFYLSTEFIICIFFIDCCMFSLKQKLSNKDGGKKSKNCMKDSKLWIKLRMNNLISLSKEHRSINLYVPVQSEEGLQIK